ncbi:Ubiquitin carboxyl-terminal hydrolase 13 [Bienertia sinuspersici]
MSIYPKGNTKFNGKNHISVDLKLANKPITFISICAKMRFFLFNQLKGNFLTIEDLRERHFHAAKNEWGISKLIPLTIFNEPSKGYLLDDICIFGAEEYDEAERLILSLVLQTSSDLIHGRTLYAEFDISLKDHFNSDKEWKQTAKTWYSSSSNLWDMSLPAQRLILGSYPSGCYNYVTVEQQRMEMV